MSRILQSRQHAAGVAKAGALLRMCIQRQAGICCWACCESANLAHLQDLLAAGLVECSAWLLYSFIAIDWVHLCLAVSGKDAM
jgi:hypothetical protein